MKKLLLTGVVVLLFSCKPTDVTIILTVDTDQLYNNPPSSKVQLYGSTTLTDDYKGRLPAKGIEHFKSKVFPNHNVTWVGVSESPDFTVAIDKIMMVQPASKASTGHSRTTKTSTNYFSSSEINGRGGKHGIAVGTVKPGVRGNYFYSLEFTIHENNGTGARSFTIDPKLKAYR